MLLLYAAVVISLAGGGLQLRGSPKWISGRSVASEAGLSDIAVAALHDGGDAEVGRRRESERESGGGVWRKHARRGAGEHRVRLPILNHD